MNDPDLNYSPDCPGFAELSAWMDGEDLPAVGAHVAGCRACDRTVKFYRKMDRAVASAMAPSPGLTQRIKGACESEARDRDVMRFWPVGLRRIAAAAALVILAAVSAYLYLGQPKPPAATVAANAMTAVVVPPPAGARVPSTSPAEVVDQGEDFVWDNEAEEWIPRGNVRAADLTMATAGIPNSAGAERGVREMADAVRHVWVVSDMENAGNTIRGSLPPETAARLSGLAGTKPITFRLVLKDRDLQGFVDKLSGAGLSLVSPDLPQPGEARKILAVGKPVLYEAELVPASAAR